MSNEDQLRADNMSLRAQISSLQSENEGLRAAAASWQREAQSLRSALAWIERALHLHGPAEALLTIGRARATSERHRRHRTVLGL